MLYQLHSHLEAAQTRKSPNYICI